MVKVAAFAGAVMAIGVSESAWADVSPEVQAWRRAHSEFDFDDREVPVLTRAPTGRDNTILRAEAVVKALLQESDLKDARAPLGQKCDSMGGCMDTFGLPKQEGIERWRDGFVASDVVEFRRSARAGDTRSQNGVDYKESEDGTLISRPGIFGLRVFSSGDAFRFVNELNGYEKLGYAEVKMDEDELEARGRSLIDSLRLIELEPDEELKLFKTQFVRFTGNTANPGERIVAAEVTFGRAIGGVPVIGKMGSTVSFEFLANGDVYRLAVDWSPLRRSEELTRFAKGETIHARVAERNGRAEKGASERPPQMICGYWDEGARALSAPVEVSLGCLVDEQESAQRYVVSADEVRVEVPDSASLKRNTLLAWEGPSDIGGEQADTPPDGAIRTLGGCSLVAGGSSAQGLWGLAIGAIVIGARRRNGRLRMARVISGVGLGLLSFCATDGQAASYATMMNRTFSNDPATGQPWQKNLTSVQWENYWDWVDEMDDIASRSVDIQGYFTSYLHYNSINNGVTYGSDLLAVSTHGTWGYSDGIYEGWGYNSAYNSLFNSHLMGAIQGKLGQTEIGLFDLCSFFSNNTTDQWNGFRNLYRGGISVATSCWGAPGEGSCALTTTGTNSTWNELGDSIADSEQTIWGSWKDGFAVSTYSDKIVVFGSGTKANSDCGTRASGVKFQNRDTFADYTWGWNEPLTGSYEVCGFVLTNW